MNGSTLIPGTSYTVRGLTKGTTYYFIIEAVNSVGRSAASNEASATTQAAPDLASISPDAGPVGSHVQLSGSGFGTVAGSVYWIQGNTIQRQTLNGSAWSEGSIATVVPSGLAAGTVSVAAYDASSGLRSAALPFDVTVPQSTGGGGGAVAPVPDTVGSAGGTLRTPDGACSVTIPAGAIPQGETVTLSDSAEAPSGIPTGFVVASPVCTLGGAVLSSAVPLTIAYNASLLDGRSPQRLSVYAEPNGGGTWTFSPTAVNAGHGTAAADATGDESLVVLENPQVFPDVPAGYWASPAIDAMLAANVIQGFPDGTFQPAGSLTRAEFTKMLVLTVGLPVGSGETSFADVPAGAWFAPYVAAAVQAGIVDGTSATTFDPNGIVTREQMAVMLARAMHLTATAPLHFSDDASIAPWALQGVEQVVAAGYMAGFPDGSFQPSATATRAQAATVLAMVLSHRAPTTGA